jgi:hypothetical protein
MGNCAAPGAMPLACLEADEYGCYVVDGRGTDNSCRLLEAEFDWNNIGFGDLHVLQLYAFLEQVNH